MSVLEVCSISPSKVQGPTGVGADFHWYDRLRIVDGSDISGLQWVVSLRPLSLHSAEV